MKDDVVLTPQEYLQQSKDGIRCAIVGCQKKPRRTCNTCKARYCDDHWMIHFHYGKAEGTGGMGNEPVVKAHSRGKSKNIQRAAGTTKAAVGKGSRAK